MASANQQPDLNQLFLQLQKRYHRSAKAKRYVHSRSLGEMNLEIGWNTYNTDYGHLRNCIIFPLKDRDSRIVSLYGRSITGQGDNAHYYLKNRRGLYPGYPGTTSSADKAKPSSVKTLILTEAIIDAASLMKHTDYTTLSLFGTNGWNAEHTAAIK